ncbi:hypothetical protein GCK32_010804, partial [Trichostrongylus colubriformis]
TTPPKGGVSQDLFTCAKDAQERRLRQGRRGVEGRGENAIFNLLDCLSHGMFADLLKDYASRIKLSGLPNRCSSGS